MVHPLASMLLVLCGLVGSAAAEQPIYQLRAVQDLAGIPAGASLDIRIEAQEAGDGSTLAAEATATWSLAIAPCAEFQRSGSHLIPRKSHAGRFALTVPRSKEPGDPYVCVARLHDGRPTPTPARLRFCVGDITLRECHPGWWTEHCVGVPAAECDRRAIAAGVKADHVTTGNLYAVDHRQSRKVPFTGGSECPIYGPKWGVVFPRHGALRRFDPKDGRTDALWSRPPEFALSSPWLNARGDILAVATSSGSRHLARIPGACARTASCVPELLRRLPPVAGRIVSANRDAVLMTHRLSNHALLVPLDPKQPSEQLSIAAPPARCRAETPNGQVRVGPPAPEAQ